MIKGNMWHTAHTQQHPWQSILLVLALLGLAGCNLPTQATEAPFIPAGNTPIPLRPSPTPEPLFQLGELVTVADGGFAYPQLNSLKSQQGAFEELQREAQVSLSAPNKDLLFSLTSEETDPGEDAQGCLERTLARMAEDITGFEDSQPVAHPVGEAQGLAVDFSGTLFEQSISGGLIVNTPQSGRCFSAIGMALGSEANELWQGQGQVLFEAILGEVRFFEVARASACPISPDPNYGYSPEAPIRVGNSNLYDGAAREEAYLQSLRGPGGEELRYERLDAIKLEGLAVLDVYELDYTGLENPLILYLDMYTFEPLMLPQGLTCTAPFPLGEP